jgi:hypothetical protein
MNRKHTDVSRAESTVRVASPRAYGAGLRRAALRLAVPIGPVAYLLIETAGRQHP